MGNPIYRLKCHDCGHQEEFFVGFSCDRSLHYLYYCSKCKEFKTITYRNNDTNFERELFCYKCQSKLEHVDFKYPENNTDNPSPLNITPQVHCPKCKSENVDIYRVGLWD